MDKWLVSVSKNGKVIHLYMSDGLRDLRAIRAIHNGLVVETVHVSGFVPDEEESMDGVHVQKSCKVRCIETGIVYRSVSFCSKATGIPKWNIYKAIQRGIAAGCLHFEYV